MPILFKTSCESFLFRFHIFDDYPVKLFQFSEMGENLDADPDLSKDTKLKKLFRDTTDWMFDTSKPVAKYDKPWYHPGRLFDSQCGEDPIKTPQNDSHLERNYALV